MKMKNKIACVLVASVLAGCVSGERREAKISEAQARSIAMNRVPDGKIKEAELEKEKGKLIWSFDMARPGTRDVTEVNVDAITGEIVAVDVESADKEKAEQHEEKEKEKGDKD
jgi:uncharacterized membrane protein YkoI